MGQPGDWWRRPEYEDRERDGQAATLWGITLVFIAFGVISLAGTALVPEWHHLIPLSAGTLALWILTLRLAAKGHLEGAAWILVLGLWGILTLGIAISGGIESPVVVTLIIVVLTAGLLLDVRSTIVMTGITTATLLGFMSCDSLGIRLPNLLPSAELWTAPLMIANLAAACSLVSNARTSIKRSQQLSRRYEREIEERNQALERSEARYQEINELTSEYFYSLRRTPGGELETELLSDAFQRVTGYEVDEIDEKLWWKMVHPDDLERTLERARASPGERAPVCEHRIITSSGEVRWIRDHSRLVVQPDGGIHLYGAAHDVTEAKEAEAERERLADQLRESQKMEAVGRLAGGIAHDFNNLLTAISGFGELLMDETQPGDEAHFAAEQIVAAADSAAELTQQLMAFSRRPTHRHGSVDADEVIRSIEPMLTRLLGETVEVRLDLAGNAIRVPGQQSLIEQVIVNLAVNARDAMPEGGRLEIATRPAPAGSYPHLSRDIDHLHIRVTDTGHGMESAVVTRAFEPFFTTKKTGEGTGLGLATVYGIIQQCGGTIQVESAPGRGTRFDIYLPQAHPDDLYIGEILESSKRSRIGPKRVLVVEDDDRVRSLIYRSLTRDGHTVLEARQGGEALDLVESHGEDIDLLVSDVVMPGIDGIELCEQLRQRHPRMRVLLVSGYASRPGSGNRTLPPEVAFLQKPFGPRGLERKLDEVFGEAPPPIGL